MEHEENKPTKKPWVKPELVFISSGDVNAKNARYVRESTAQFAYTNSGKDLVVNAAHDHITYRSNAAFS
jgi:hypothetical protein